MKTKQNILNLLYKNKQHLNGDGYLHFEKSIETPVYGVSEENARLKFHWIDGVQLLFNKEMRIWEVVLWLSTKQSEVLGKVNLILVPETLYDAIYEETNHTLNVVNSYKQIQTSKTKTPMKEYEINERAILDTRAKLMANAKSVEEQEQIRKLADMSAVANRELEIERLLSKFGAKVNVLGGIRAAFIKDNRGNDVTIFLVHELVYITEGELVEGNAPKAFFEFDAESQMGLLKCLQADIKEKLTKALSKARKEGSMLRTAVLAQALEEEFGEEE